MNHCDIFPKIHRSFSLPLVIFSIHERLLRSRLKAGLSLLKVETTRELIRLRKDYVNIAINVKRKILNLISFDFATIQDLTRALKGKMGTGICLIFRAGNWDFYVLHCWEWDFFYMSLGMGKFFFED